MFNIGPPELIVILLVALLIVGPKRLPEVGKSVGKALREIRRQTDEVRSSFEMNLDDDPDDHAEDEPIQDMTASAPMAAAEDDADEGWDATKWKADDADAPEPDAADSPDSTSEIVPEGDVSTDAADEAESVDTTPAEPADGTEPVAAPAGGERRRRRGPKAEPAPDGGGTTDAS